jgi:hypothetical protein
MKNFLPHLSFSFSLIGLTLCFPLKGLAGGDEALSSDWSPWARMHGTGGNLNYGFLTAHLPPVRQGRQANPNATESQANPTKPAAQSQQTKAEEPEEGALHRPKNGTISWQNTPDEDEELQQHFTETILHSLRSINGETLATIQMMVDGGGDIHALDPETGGNALHILFSYCQLDQLDDPVQASLIHKITAYLLDKNVDIQAEDDDGETPFAWSINLLRQDPSLLKIVLDHILKRFSVQGAPALRDPTIRILLEVLATCDDSSWIDAFLKILPTGRALRNLQYILESYPTLLLDMIERYQWDNINSFVTYAIEAPHSPQRQPILQAIQHQLLNFIATRISANNLPPHAEKMAKACLKQLIEAGTPPPAAKSRRSALYQELKRICTPASDDAEADDCIESFEICD